jgi:hypothetical protein
MKLAEFIEDHHDQHLAELCAFLRIPSVSAKSEHKPDIERAARLVSLGPISGMRRSSVFRRSLHGEGVDLGAADSYFYAVGRTGIASLHDGAAH